MGFAQVNLQKGAAQINLPIYKYTDNLSKLSLDLSLGYSSGNGLSVDNVSDAVGTNWELTGIPIIVRQQKGSPDDQTVYNGGGMMYTHFVAIKGCPKVLNYYPLAETDGQTYRPPTFASQDRQLDNFQLFLGGRLINFSSKQMVFRSLPMLM